MICLNEYTREKDCFPTIYNISPEQNDIIIFTQPFSKRHFSGIWIEMFRTTTTERARESQECSFISDLNVHINLLNTQQTICEMDFTFYFVRHI